MKTKVNFITVFLYTTYYISKSECMLEEDDILSTDPRKELFLETYIQGTPTSLSYNSEKALKFVSSSSEDLQRLFMKELEVRSLIEKYKSNIGKVLKAIHLKGGVSTNREQFLRNLRKVTKTYYRPSEEFETTGGLGLVRLDDVHDLDKIELANGTINLPRWGARLESVHKLTIGDAMLLSHTAGRNNLLNRQVEWVELACAMGERSGSEKLQYLKNYLKHLQGEHDQLILEKGFSIEVESEAEGFVITNKQPYDKKLRKHKKMKVHLKDLKNEDKEYKVFQHLVHGRQSPEGTGIDFKKWNVQMYLKVRTDISNLCTGTESTSTTYKCHLQFTKDPFIKLSPFKVEIFYDDPIVAVIHNFVSGKESNWVKDHVRGRMRAATYFQRKSKASDSDESVRVDFSADRTSKTRFVADYADPKVKRLSERISYATNWNIGNNWDDIKILDREYWGSENMNSENFRVMNYGPGGWVSPHIDTGGDGISSFMLYLSSGVIGGHTIFPMLGLAIKPKPNAALVWYGRDQSGIADIRSLHVGCPVVHGNKWAALKLVQYNGQWDNTLCRPDKTVESIPLFSYKKNITEEAFEEGDENDKKSRKEKLRIYKNLHIKMAKRKEL